ncbi:hypothetical protein [Streptomyces lunaelactis]|uniref:hypothetical protein n=1 Tax=Streptomyces lunaelactis TaxID=1535768 RepID=UPI0015857AD5|nr:hypothetical protein [Streptomyces lunaelactis]NUL12675.1 hypothetical protein [Streptomyces lunaelactis]NUL26424.1 hypothetical protein [Streptomyces lunaelactis]
MLPRWVKVGVVAAVVLAAVGYWAKPYANDWWLARQACGGAMPDEAVDKLIPGDKHLASDYEYVSKELGTYSCALSDSDSDTYRRRGISAVGYTNRDSQDLMIKRAFHDGTGRNAGALPEGLPGFDDEAGVRLLLTCPSLGKDAEGRPRRLLVRTSAERGVMKDQRDASLRTAVALTNEASKKLGCGAEPLKAPARALPEEPKPVSLSAAAGTACGWLAGAKLPKGTNWTVSIAANDAAPLSRCELHRYGDDEVAMFFNASYGDWSEVPFKDAADERASSSADGWVTQPLLTAEWGRAKARCDAEAANFEAGSRNEVPGIKGPQLRALLTAFAQDQVKRHGCTDLALPGRELPVPKTVVEGQSERFEHPVEIRLVDLDAQIGDPARGHLAVLPPLLQDGVQLVPAVQLGLLLRLALRRASCDVAHRRRTGDRPGRGRERTPAVLVHRPVEGGGIADRAALRGVGTPLHE